MANDVKKSKPATIKIVGVSDYDESKYLISYRVKYIQNVVFTGLVFKDKVKDVMETYNKVPETEFMMFGNGVYINWLGISQW